MTFSVFLQAFALPGMTSADRVLQVVREYRNFVTYLVPDDVLDGSFNLPDDGSAQAVPVITAPPSGAVVLKNGVTVTIVPQAPWSTQVLPGSSPVSAYMVTFDSKADADATSAFLDKAVTAAELEGERVKREATAKRTRSQHRGRVYKWRPMDAYWMADDKYTPRPLSTMVGDVVPPIVASVKAQVDFLINEGRAKLKLVGETVDSLDVLFYGEPGGGKSSAAQVLATMLDMAPIYKVDAADLTNPKRAAHVLAPNVDDIDFIIVLVEDADRMGELTKAVSNELSGVLNAMSGVSSVDRTFVLRIFTANDESRLLNIDALASRISPANRFKFVPLKDRVDLVEMATTYLGTMGKVAESAAFIESLRSAPANVSMRALRSFLMAYMFRDKAGEEMARDAPVHLHGITIMSQKEFEALEEDNECY